GGIEAALVVHPVDGVPQHVRQLHVPVTAPLRQSGFKIGGVARLDLENSRLLVWPLAAAPPPPTVVLRGVAEARPPRVGDWARPGKLAARCGGASPPPRPAQWPCCGRLTKPWPRRVWIWGATKPG